MLKHECIKLARKKAGLTQEQLATALGLKRAVISKYETGQIEPSISQLEKIADILGISFFDLFPDEYHSPLKEVYEIGYCEREVEVRDEVEFACNELERRKKDALYRGILLSFDKLTPDGKRKVLEYAEDLVTNPKYQIASSDKNDE